MTDRILLIEDDLRLAEMVKSYLGEAGFRVSVAGRGEAGIAMLAREPFDSIILDLMLPDMDGLEVCRRIRARAQTPILMLTARGDATPRRGARTGRRRLICRSRSSRVSCWRGCGRSCGVRRRM